MTEWSSGNGTFNALWDCGGCSGGPDGMYLANDITQAFNRGNVNAYIYWWGTANGPAALIETSGGTYTVAKRFYAIAPFSRFVRPGAYRVGRQYQQLQSECCGAFAIPMAAKSSAY